MIGSGKESGMIVIGQFIHSHLHGRVQITCHVVRYWMTEGISIASKVSTFFITVLLHTGQEPGHRLHKCIVIHNRIPLFTIQPFCRIAIMFRKNQRIRIRFLYCLTKLLPKFMVIFVAVSQVCCHIQSPAIYIIWLRYPFSGNMQNILFQSFGMFIV